MASAANDNVPARVLDLKAARLDRDPEQKIGHIAMALERRGEATERRNPWRAVVARNLDRFSAWIAFQRTRLEDLWGRFQRAARSEREGEGLQGGSDQGKDGRSGFTPEQRDRLLGRRTKPKGREKPPKDERER